MVCAITHTGTLPGRDFVRFGRHVTLATSDRPLIMENVHDVLGQILPMKVRIAVDHFRTDLSTGSIRGVCPLS
jgi:hypothetical protein